MSWPGLDQVLVKPWPGIGQVLAKSCPGIGQVLARYWPGLRQVLARFWPGLGQVLARSWGSLGVFRNPGGVKQRFAAPKHETLPEISFLKENFGFEQRFLHRLAH